MTRLGIYGGSFHPPHRGHGRAAAFFREACALDQLWIIPAKEPVLREALEGASPSDRLAMCRLAFSGYPCTQVSDAELRRPGVSYTIDTLRQAAEDCPGSERFLLVGGDQLAQFSRWKDWREILALCTLTVLPRDSAPLALPAQLREQRERVRLLEGFEPLPARATEIRARLRSGEDVSGDLDSEVLSYIKERRLYGYDPTDAAEDP
ncbi:MAG: nicotinate (nicotinamide) nucleotide adenylyltransferase [Oscillospiraceae bacterium]|jgi:nicotinate-nucleotide adenylyltransferase|nr:nicotinate (nicotinamide) nucleotide adenylyltransferase [Oscillospiraceae bacterium]